MLFSACARISITRNNRLLSILSLVFTFVILGAAIPVVAATPGSATSPITSATINPSQFPGWRLAPGQQITLQGISYLLNDASSLTEEQTHIVVIFRRDGMQWRKLWQSAPLYAADDRLSIIQVNDNKGAVIVATASSGGNRGMNEILVVGISNGAVRLLNGGGDDNESLSNNSMVEQGDVWVAYYPAEGQIRREFRLTQGIITESKVLTRELYTSTDILVRYFLQSDNSIRVEKNTVEIPAGKSVFFIPGDARTRQAYDNGEISLYHGAGEGEAGRFGPVPRVSAESGEDGAEVCITTGWEGCIPAVIIVNFMTYSTNADNVQTHESVFNMWATVDEVATNGYAYTTKILTSTQSTDSGSRRDYVFKMHGSSVQFANQPVLTFGYRNPMPRPISRNLENEELDIPGVALPLEYEYRNLLGYARFEPVSDSPGIIRAHIPAAYFGNCIPLTLADSKTEVTLFGYEEELNRVIDGGRPILSVIYGEISGHLAGQPLTFAFMMVNVLSNDKSRAYLMVSQAGGYCGTEPFWFSQEHFPMDDTGLVVGREVKGTEEFREALRQFGPRIIVPASDTFSTNAPAYPSWYPAVHYLYVQNVVAAAYVSEKRSNPFPIAAVVRAGLLVDEAVGLAGNVISDLAGGRVVNPFDGDVKSPLTYVWEKAANKFSDRLVEDGLVLAEDRDVVAAATTELLPLALEHFAGMEYLNGQGWIRTLLAVENNQAVKDVRTFNSLASVIPVFIKAVSHALSRYLSVGPRAVVGQVERNEETSYLPAVPPENKYLITQRVIGMSSKYVIVACSLIDADILGPKITKLFVIDARTGERRMLPAFLPRFAIFGALAEPVSILGDFLYCQTKTQGHLGISRIDLRNGTILELTDRADEYTLTTVNDGYVMGVTSRKDIWLYHIADGRQQRINRDNFSNFILFRRANSWQQRMNTPPEKDKPTVYGMAGNSLVFAKYCYANDTELRRRNVFHLLREYQRGDTNAICIQTLGSSVTTPIQISTFLLNEVIGNDTYCVMRINGRRQDRIAAGISYPTLTIFAYDVRNGDSIAVAVHDNAVGYNVATPFFMDGGLLFYSYMTDGSNPAEPRCVFVVYDLVAKKQLIHQAGSFSSVSNSRILWWESGRAYSRSLDDIVRGRPGVLLNPSIFEPFLQPLPESQRRQENDGSVGYYVSEATLRGSFLKEGLNVAGD